MATTYNKYIKRVKSFLLFLYIARLHVFKWFFLTKKKKYGYLQRTFYDYLAKKSHYSPGEFCDNVVGSYDEHNHWMDYDTYLLAHIDDSFLNKTALDFGCGPGRNIIKYYKRFKRLDGVDISNKNIEHAKRNLLNNQIFNSHLFVNNGIDLSCIASNVYDFIMSTICFQHICVYQTRYSLLKEFFRTLKPNGRITIQMGFGQERSFNTVFYYSNHYNAMSTNSGCDTRVESSDQIYGDLVSIGFSSFEHWIRSAGPGEKNHSKWIFFTAIKDISTDVAFE